MKNLINGQKPEFGNLEKIKILQDEQRSKNIEDEFDEPMSWGLAMGTINAGHFFISQATEVYEEFALKTPKFKKPPRVQDAKFKTFLLQIQACYEDMIPCHEFLEQEDIVKELKEKLAKVNKELKKLINIKEA